MLPAGVDTIAPSQISSGMRTMPSTVICSFAVCRVWRSSETSLMASASCIAPSTVVARIRSGCRITVRAAATRLARSSSWKSFSRKPTEPQFMP